MTKVSRKWKVHKAHFYLLILCLLLSIPGTYVVSGFIDKMQIVDPNSFLFALLSIGPMVFMVMILAVLVFRFRCPQCEKQFYGSFKSLIKMSNCCANCGSQRNTN